MTKMTPKSVDSQKIPGCSSQGFPGENMVFLMVNIRKHDFAMANHGKLLVSIETCGFHEGNLKETLFYMGNIKNAMFFV